MQKFKYNKTKKIIKLINLKDIITLFKINRKQSNYKKYLISFNISNKKRIFNSQLFFR